MQRELTHSCAFALIATVLTIVCALACAHPALAEEIIPYPGTADGNKVQAEGDFGTALYWKYWDDATLEVSGTGDMPDFTEGAQPWNSLQGKIEHVVVHDGVTSIGARSFQDCKLVNYVRLPEGLTRVGAYAFRNNELLTSIHIPSSVTTIDEYAFYGERNLKQIELPTSLTSISAYAFSNCESANNDLTIPAGVTSIEKYAFSGCWKIKSIVLNEGLTTVGEYAFSWLQDVKSITVSSTVASMGSCAFMTTAGVRPQLIFASGTTKISYGVPTCFNIQASEVVIPSSVTSIDQYTIAGSGNYVVDSDNEAFSSIDGSIYAKVSGDGEYTATDAAKQDVLYLVKGGCTGVFEVPAGTKVIDNKAFSASASAGITGIKIPASVEAIYPESSVNGFKYTGQVDGSESYTFLGNLVNLASIEVDAENANFASEDSALYSKDFSHLYRVAPAISGAYYMRDSVTTLEPNIFRDMSNMTDLFFSKELIHIPSFLINSKNNIYNYHLPLSINNAPQQLVSYEPSTKVDGVKKCIFFEGTKDQWDATQAGKTLNNNPIKYNVAVYRDVKAYGKLNGGTHYCLDSQGKLTILPDGPISSGERVVPAKDTGGSAWGPDVLLATSCDIISPISQVGSHVFDGFTALQKVTLPESIQTVDAGAFAGCTDLSEVTCEGEPFSVVAASENGASFNSEKVTIQYPSSSDAWVSVLDVSGLWNGYKTQQYIPANLPCLARATVIQTTAEMHGIIENPTGTTMRDSSSVRIAYYTSDGIDISDKVTVEVLGLDVAPLSADYATRFRTINSSGRTLKELKYIPSDHLLASGGCLPAGTYTVKATPIAGKATGNALTSTITIVRDAEQVSNWKNEKNVVVYGGEQEFVQTYTPHIYNQYAEDITDDLSMRLWDVTANKDITNSDEELQRLGIQLNGKTVSVSSMAMPRKYKMVFTDTTKGRLGTAAPTFEVTRDPDILNKAYTLSIKEGPEEIAFQEGGVWSSAPFRTLIKDAYQDPCWPTTFWHVYQNGKDVTSYFDLDEQGYLFVRDTVKPLLSGERTKFTLKEASNRASKYWLNGGITDERDFYVLLKSETIIPTHTATFMAGDVVVAQVEFAEGDASLNEPVVPDKENYIGAWEAYDLANAKSDITIHAVYTLLEPGQVSDIGGSSDAEYKDGQVVINLSAAAASKTVKVATTATKPVDVVLVLDQSGSMADPLTATGSQSKRDALVQCAKDFVNQLAANAQQTGANHRVALAGFAFSNYQYASNSAYAAYKNTGLLVTENGTGKWFNALKQADYANALLPVSVNGAVSARVITGLDSIVAEGATAADAGLEIARNVFSANPVSTGAGGAERERVVVFLTDGNPTWWGPQYDPTLKASSRAISVAETIKQGQGARIYCVGVDAAADASASATETGAANTGITGSGNNVTFDFNRFLHLVSSNFPEATSMGNRGVGSKDAGYYMAVTDTSNLGSIFTNILYNTVYTIEAFDRATLAYTLPSNLVLTMKQEEELRAALAEDGLVDDDIIVETDDSATYLMFKNVPVKAVVGADGVERYEARVSFAVSAPDGVSGVIDAGCGEVLHGADKVMDVPTANVTVPGNRCLVVFKMNDAIYEIRDMEMGAAIEVPDTNLARWLDLEQKQDLGEAYVTEPVAVFTTTTLTREYTIEWKVGDWSKVVSYKPGVAVEPPAEVAGQIPAGYELTGWAPYAPATMPARNVVCTAVLSSVHVHNFGYATTVSGSCDSGLVTHHICICGEEETEQALPKAHAYKATMASSGGYTTVEKLVCEDCGDTVDKNVSYKVEERSAGGWYTTYLDLSKFEGEVVQDGPSSDAISMRFLLGNRGYKSYTVYRIDADGKMTKYTPTLVDGFLVFDPDHFSIYVIGEADTEQNAEAVLADVTYADAVKVLNGEEPDTGDDTPGGGTSTAGGGGGAVAPAGPKDEEPEQPAEDPDEVEEPQDMPFTDVAEDDWFVETAQRAAHLGIMGGVKHADGTVTFDGNSGTSRAMVAQILANIEHCQAIDAAAFADVKPGAWYADAVAWANEKGIVQGYGTTGRFGPEDAVSREQLAVMMMRYATYLGMDTSKRADLSRFPDAAGATFGTDALQWAVAEGLIGGYATTGELAPTAGATRAETATILLRFIDLMV